MKLTVLVLIFVSLLASCSTSHKKYNENVVDRNPSNNSDDCIVSVDDILSNSRSEADDRDLLVKIFFLKDEAALKLLTTSSASRGKVIHSGMVELLTSALNTHLALDRNWMADSVEISNLPLYQAFSIGPVDRTNRAIVGKIEAHNSLYIDVAIKNASVDEQIKYFQYMKNFFRSLGKYNRSIDELNLQREINIELEKFKADPEGYLSRRQIERRFSSQDELSTYFPEIIKLVESEHANRKSIIDRDSALVITNIFRSLLNDAHKGSDAENKKGAEVFMRGLKTLFSGRGNLYDIEYLKLIIDSVLAPIDEQRRVGLAKLPNELKEVLDFWVSIKKSYDLSPLVRSGERLTQNQTVARFKNKVALVGKVVKLETDTQNHPTYIKYAGPVAMLENKQNGKLERELAYSVIPGQDEIRHAHGFSSPLGEYSILVNGNEFKGNKINSALLKSLVNQKAAVQFRFTSGYKISGILTDSYSHSESGEVVVLTFEDCNVFNPKNKRVYNKEWGPFDFLVTPVAIGVD